MTRKKRRKGTTHYNSAGAFAQGRLDKYVASVASGSVGVFPSGYGGGAYGGGYAVPSPSITPTNLGFAPYAIQLGADLTSWPVTILSSHPLLHTSFGNTLLSPIWVSARMNIAGASFRINGAGSSQDVSYRWDLYRETGSHVLTRVAHCSATVVETIPSATSKFILADPYPTPIVPGIYWFSLQNTTPTFQIRVASQTTSAGPTGMTNRFTRIGDADNEAETIDFTDWESTLQIPSIILHGVGFGETDAYGSALPAVIFT